MDMSQRVARVGNVVDDQHLRIGEVELVEVGRQGRRNIEAFIDAGVELDVHHVEVLHR